MKITELTQKSHSEQLSEDRSKLDEIAWAPITAAAGAGLSAYDLGSRFGYKPWEWTAAQWKQAGAEIAADAALGATGVGLLSVANKARKVGTRAVKGLGKKKVSKLEKDAEKAMADKGLAPDGSPLPPTPATTATPPKPKPGIVKRAATATGVGAVANAASQEIQGKPIIAPSDIPVLGKKASGKPQPNTNRIDRVGKDIGNATKPPYTGKSLADQGNF